MSVKQEIQQLSSRLESCNHKLTAAKSRGDQAMMTKFTDDVAALTKQVTQLKNKQNYVFNKERKRLLDMPFSREITKAEQADMGKLKNQSKALWWYIPQLKSVKNFVSVMTGFAPGPF
ncbi:YibL family ribosome-associated protein [Vibrio sp. PP-XX7]